MYRLARRKLLHLQEIYQVALWMTAGGPATCAAQLPAIGPLQRGLQISEENLHMYNNGRPDLHPCSNVLQKKKKRTKKIKHLVSGTRFQKRRLLLKHKGMVCVQHLTIQLIYTYVCNSCGSACCEQLAIVLQSLSGSCYAQKPSTGY